MNISNKGIKKIVSLVVVIIFVFITSYIVLAHDFIGRPGYNDARWRVEFTSIAEVEKTGSASSRYSPYHTSTYASFYVDFVAPGDSITYEFQVANLGTLKAQLDSIDIVTNPYNNAIKYQIIGIKEGEVLKKGEVRNVKIKISYELHSNVAVEFDKPISILFGFKQAN